MQTTAKAGRIIITRPFTQDATYGYTDSELNLFNREWATIITSNKLEFESDEYWRELSRFSHQVAHLF